MSNPPQPTLPQAEIFTNGSVKGPARSLLIKDDQSIHEAVQLLVEEAASLFARRIAVQPDRWIDRELIAAELLRARVDRVLVRFECEHPAPGSWMEVVAYPSPDGLALSVWDISERKQAEAALAESEAYYRDLFEDAPIGYQELDLEGRFVRVNRTQLAMLGYAKDEMIGRHIWDFQWVHGEDPVETRRNFFEKMMSGRLPPTFERVRVRKDGTLLPVLVEDRFIRDASGAITGLRSTMLDITRRKEWEGAQARLAAIVESSGDAIIGKNLDGVITSWNPGATAIYGYAPEEVLGRPVSLLIPPEQANELPAILARPGAGNASNLSKPGAWTSMADAWTCPSRSRRSPGRVARSSAPRRSLGTSPSGSAPTPSWPESGVHSSWRPRARHWPTSSICCVG